MDQLKSGTNELLPAADLATMQGYAEDEFQQLWAAFVGQDAVVTGLTPSIPGTGLSADIAEGIGYKADGSKVKVPADGTYVTFSAAHATLPRIDAITITPTKADTDQQTRNFKINGVVTPQSTYKRTIDSFTAHAIAGTATSGANLTNLTGAPAIPAGDIFIGYVLVPAGATNLSSGDLQDGRVMLPTLFAATPADDSVTIAKLDPAVYATAATPETLAYRDAAGRVKSADPAAAADVATMGWVQAQTAAAAAGLTDKGAVRAMQSTNRILSGLSAVDGVTIIADDLVLLTGQSTGAENGPWVAASGAWSRPSNFDTSAEALPGSFWFVNEGSTYGNTGWWLTTDGPITLGTTSLTLTQLTGPGAIQATSPIVRTGNTISHATSGATAGTYTNATVTIDDKGHVTSVSNGALGVSVAILEDQKSAGTAAQGTTSGSYVTRNLNTEVSDADGIVALSSNQFTLDAGKYVIEWWSMVGGNTNGSGKTRLRNVTDSTTAAIGSTAAASSGTTAVPSNGSAYLNLTASKAFEVQIWTSSSALTGGIALNTGEVEVYTQVKITKVG